MNQQVLIVEDEPKIAALLADYLHASGFITHHIDDGAEVVDWVKNNKPNMVLLDLMLPNKDGLSICRDIRQFSELPVIMLTAKVEEIDRLLGLELGADDYICKPFSPREVVARVKTVLRRFEPKRETQEAQKSDLYLDEGKMKALWKHQDLQLTAVEFALLHLLVGEPGRIFNREQLMRNMYRDERIVSERSIDSHIKKLRKKIDAVVPGAEWIQSVYSVGYKYEPTDS